VGEIEAAVNSYLSQLESVESESYLNGWQATAFLAEHVDRIYVAEVCMCPFLTKIPQKK